MSDQLYTAHCYVQLVNGGMGPTSFQVRCDGTEKDAAQRIVREHPEVAAVHVEQLVRPFTVMEKKDV